MPQRVILMCPRAATKRGRALAGRWDVQRVYGRRAAPSAWSQREEEEATSVSESKSARDAARVVRAGIWVVLGALWTLSVGAGCTGQGGPSMEELLQRVDRRLDQAVPEMAECFRRELGGEAELVNGRIVVRFEIGGDGLVATLDVVESELRGERANMCVSDTIRRIHFADWQGRQPVRLTKPFQFVAGR